MEKNISIYDEISLEPRSQEIDVKKIFEINGIKLMLHREWVGELKRQGKMWIVSDYDTGYNLDAITHRTMKEAIASAENILQGLIPESIKEAKANKEIKTINF
jgi:hypothetical protein